MADRQRRETLKIIGAISSTCAFPFSSDELFAQHEHGAHRVAALPAAPSFFTAEEFQTVTRLADLIIPETETPGAVKAGVPAYIDMVVGRNEEAQRLCREGLRWLDRQSRRRHGKAFTALAEAEQVALLTPLCEQADAASRWVRTNHPRPRKRKKLPLAVAFFRTMKSLTADGFYTSEAGLVGDLDYKGNTVLAEFPACVHEH